MNTLNSLSKKSGAKQFVAIPQVGQVSLYVLLCTPLNFYTLDQQASQ